MAEQQFVELLQTLLKPNTEGVKAATATLNKEYYTSPASLTALLQILTSHESSALRQLAAVESRKLVSKHWAAVPADQKPTIRNQLLQTTFTEDDKLVRHSKARVVSAIAQYDLEDGQWGDLPPLLQRAAVEQNAQHREVGVYILFTLLETLGDLFTENLTDLFTLFSKTIQDPESMDVKINTMLCLSRIAMMVDPDEDERSLKLFQDAVPHLVAVLKATVDAGDEEHALQAFEIFQTLIGLESALLNNHFGDLIKFMIDLASQTEIDDEYRAQALAFLMSCVRYRKLKIQGLRLGELITTKALQIVTELGDLSAEEEDVTPARSALGLLDILASSLPPTQVVVPLLKAIGPYVTSQDPDYRRAGILALGMCVEGAPDFISTQLKEILPLVLHLLEDQDIKVRAAALNGVARLADDLAEDMGEEHSRLIPALIKNFDLAITQDQKNERNLEIIRGSCNAVDSFIEGLDTEDAAKYVPELVPRFSQLFEHEDYKSRIAAIGAIGSIAAAGEEAFLPFFEPTMRALGPYISLKESQADLDLRGVVCDSLGKIASAVGAEPFKPYVGPLMHASEEALHLDHPRLRETSYILWSTIAKVYEENFEPYLEGCIQGLQECLQQDEAEDEVQLGEEAKDLIGAEVSIAGKKVRVVSATNDDDDDDILDGIDGDDDDWDDLLGGMSAVAMEKEIAIEVVGDVITYTRRKFLPYFQKTVEIILGMVDHEYEGVRKSAIGTLWRAFACLWGLEEGSGMEKWKPGIPLQVQPTDDLIKFGRLVMTGTLQILTTEEDRATVTDINRSLAASLKLCGPAVLTTESGTVVKELTEQLVIILTKKHPCQQDLGDEGDDEVMEESSEYDWLVIETALDVVSCFSVALGPSFGELWKIFNKPVIKYASSQERSERSQSVGTIAECIGNMGVACTEYTSALLKLLLHRLSDEDPDTKSNAAYAVGLLCENSGAEQEILKAYPTICAKLDPMLSEGQHARMLDNAAGCVSRMISAHPTHIPVSEVLPRLVQFLPLREDFEEHKPIFQMIFKLYQSNDATIQQLTPQLMQVFQKVVESPEEQVDEETKTKIVELVQYLQSK
ncbi:ARM repeat-containing protein [Patellaria atrata CBS 101060]|uniref:ARM repeat-containing protein n=1 Tax=Patellaria atrata CBS 101060 TaxID=1346257 RepID=A0A9P4S7K6_9PEZI|nr:ARM repeat-containing protein [Patellaria atrata CBS 101060]